MKRLLILFALLFAMPASSQSVNSPCYWSGQLVKCFPTTGILLDGNRSIRYGETTANGANYVEVKAPASLGADFVMTLPAATDTFVGKATSDVLTNKTLNGNTATNLISGSGTLTLNTSGTVTVPNATDTLVGLATTDTLTNKTLTSPKLNENVAVTTTATKLNLITSAAGSTGTNTTNIVFSTSPVLTTPTIGVATATSINKMAITAPSSSSTLAVADGKTFTASNTLTLTGTDSSSIDFGAGGTAAYTALAQYNVDVGNSSGVEIATNTNLLGDISATTTSQAYTVTNASPAVYTVTSHGFLTGDKAYVTVTQNGFTANTTYYVHKIDANTFHLCTTLANASAGTGINSSGNTAGTIKAGGFVLTSGVKGDQTSGTATAGYVGEYMHAEVGSTAHTTGQYADRGTVTLTPGTWDITGCGGIIPAATTTVTRLDVGINATTTGNSCADCTNMLTAITQFFHAGNVPTDEYGFCTPPVRVNLSTATAYITKVFITYATSTATSKGSIRATRVR